MSVAVRTLLTLAAILVQLSCSTGARDQDVAARVGDRAITVKELDDRWRENDPAQLAQARQALYEGRRAALDDLIASTLIEHAAKAKGIPAQQYVGGEVARRVKPVSDADIAVFYGENRGQMQGRSLEEMNQLIRRYLDDRQKQSARAALVAELRKAGPAVSVMIEAPRQDIALAPEDPVQGPASAPVTIVEFSDFQCPFCRRVAPTLKQVKAKYGDRVRIVWKDFPLTQIHPQAFEAAQAGNCAREQGKFWEYHDQLFANQSALQPALLKQYATDAGLDAAAFSACFDSHKFEAKVQQAMTAGTRVGVSSTPTTFINGRMVSGAQPYEAFASVIDEELARGGRR